MTPNWWPWISRRSLHEAHQLYSIPLEMTRKALAECDARLESAHQEEDLLRAQRDGHSDSRRAAESEAERLRGERDELKASIASERARVDLLMAQLYELKRDGYVVERTPTSAIPDPTPAFPKVIEDAIRDVTDPGTKERQLVIEWATRECATASNGTPATLTAIAKQIRKGWVDDVEERAMAEQVSEGDSDGN
jgi:hypothetical protein